MLATQIGFIGAGRMATALARGFVNAKLVEPRALVVSDPSSAARHQFGVDVLGAKIVEANDDVVSHSDVVILAVKPQQITDVLVGIHETVRRDALVVSIAAGVTLARLAAGLPPRQRVIRVMPNTPCLIGRGASAFSLGPNATAEDGRLVAQLLSAVGVAHEVPEEQLDAVTGLSGSGPAFAYTMIELLSEGGVAMGLPAALAADLATHTVAGAAEMILTTGETPAVLRDRVTSPGGTTLAGLKALEDGGFRAAVIGAVTAATRRSAELGKSSS
ncbi:MAG TPA: pyrroline-5-carboxylate reductase [Lacipirellulaceae bacterium]|jgi:pyrroline-5-carboxylate reductase